MIGEFLPLEELEQRTINCFSVFPKGWEGAFFSQTLLACLGLLRRVEAHLRHALLPGCNECGQQPLCLLPEEEVCMMEANLQGSSSLTPPSQLVFGCTSRQQGLCDDCFRKQSKSDMTFSIA